jgi:hypothetical protein
LKDFAQVRGWFAITLGPRKLKEAAVLGSSEEEKSNKKAAAATAEGEQKKGDGVSAAADVDDEERMIQEIETMKLEFEQCRQQVQPLTLARAKRALTICRVWVYHRVSCRVCR